MVDIQFRGGSETWDAATHAALSSEVLAPGPSRIRLPKKDLAVAKRGQSWLLALGMVAQELIRAGLPALKGSFSTQ